MILTHAPGSQEDQFDGKNGRKKSHDTIPLRDAAFNYKVLDYVHNIQVHQ